MANLLLTALGQRTLRKAACWLAANRASYPFHRSFYLAWNDWKTSGNFDFSAMLNNLNPTVQDDLLQFGALLDELGCCSDSTIENLTIYVDENGSDTDGDGSSDNPFASFAFVENLPHNINHIVNIVITSNVVENNPLIFDHNIGYGGAINIIGQGTPNTVTTSLGAGPFTLTGVTAYNTPNTAGFEFTIAGAFGADELYGTFIKFVTGGFTGFACPIAGNDGAGNIYTQHFYTGSPNIGDQFIVIRPTHTFSCPAFDLNCKGPPMLSVFKQQTRFGLYNLEIAMGGGATWQERVFNVRNECHTTISLVRIGHVNLNYPCALDAPINHDLNYDTANIATLAACGITNLEWDSANGGNVGASIYNSVWPPLPDYSKVEVQIGNCVTDPAKNIAGITGRGKWFLLGQYGVLSGCLAGELVSLYGAAGRISRCLLYGDKSHVAAADCFTQESGCNQLHFVYFLGGTNCISVENGDIVLKGCTAGGAATFTGYGIEFTGSARVLTTTSPATITGATNDLLFPVLGAAVHPAVGNQQADLLGNYESYV
jgi:hypothetical protein